MIGTAYSRITDAIERISRHRAIRLVLPLALALLMLACGESTHPRDTLNPAGDGAQVSAWFFWLYMILDTIIFIIVMVAMIVAIMKFSKKPDDDDSLPPQSHGDMRLEIMWTVIPTIIIVVLAVITVGGVFQLSAKPSEEQKIVDIEVMGKQWWWEFDYKKERISTANEMHVEAGTQVSLHLTSADVIHAFWVPRMSGKRDATPGRTYPLYFKPFASDKLEEYIGQCAELCGASHARMGIKLFVHPKTGPDSYDNWVKKQQEAARAPATALEKQGKKVFETKGCKSCHTIRGVAELTKRSRSTGPDLTHVGSRSTIAALALTNTIDNLAKWVKNPQAVKEAALMTNLNLTDEESKAVATYLYSLK
ncbi:MAG TPA: cytochrome c oxidase subunit II [Myxococcales bacterium]|nr:cytochrome c oxidase subunit II [Myxococcales bacterium]